MKIIDKITALQASKTPFFSFEFFPPRSAAGVENLYKRVDRMATLNPLFVSVTWNAASSDATIELASKLQHLAGVDVLMHVALAGMNVAQLKAVLERARTAGIENLLLLQGDTFEQPCHGGLSYASELVRLARDEHGGFFCIAVAGHPEGHPNCTDRRSDLTRLKEKVDAGADFVLTQLFFESSRYMSFLDEARAAGVYCPIIPGVMLVQSEGSFRQLVGSARLSVPSSLQNALVTLQQQPADAPSLAAGCVGKNAERDQAVKQIGIEHGIVMCNELLASGRIAGLHFFTLNLERSVRAVLAGVGLVEQHRDGTGTNVVAGIGRGVGAVVNLELKSGRRLPWRPSAQAHRAAEDVRPIYWANRPRSYITRTESWEEFPTGRWGSASAGHLPAFGEMQEGNSDERDRDAIVAQWGTAAERRALWGDSLMKIEEVHDVFARYIGGDPSMPKLPWCDTPLLLETGVIKQQLMDMNSAGFLTINSQPRLNGVSSSHPAFGWGEPGGYIYQKAYVECFLSPMNLRRLMRVAEAHPSIMFVASDVSGNRYIKWTGLVDSNVPSVADVTGTATGNCRVAGARTGRHGGGATAVTWGVFPDHEVKQPTIVDPAAFMAWKDEAFALWRTIWASAYEDDSPTQALLYNMHDTYFLLSVVDNDYVAGDIWRLFAEATPAYGAGESQVDSSYEYGYFADVAR